MPKELIVSEHLDIGKTHDQAALLQLLVQETNPDFVLKYVDLEMPAQA